VSFELVHVNPDPSEAGNLLWRYREGDFGSKPATRLFDPLKGETTVIFAYSCRETLNFYFKLQLWDYVECHVGSPPFMVYFNRCSNLSTYFCIGRYWS